MLVAERSIVSNVAIPELLVGAFLIAIHEWE